MTTKTFVVIDGPVRVRISPGGLQVQGASLTNGQEVQVEAHSRTEQGGFVWWKHSLGWSAERATDGSRVFLQENATVTAAGSTSPSSTAAVPNAPAPAPVAAAPASAPPSIDPNRYINPGPVAAGEVGPGRDTLITRMPVNLEQTQWFQYFGNTVFAFQNGKNFNYDGYSQGLHGGLDFGNNNPSGVLIYAGIECEYIKSEFPNENNVKIWAKAGDYTIIYQHITSLRTFKAGDKLAPDTVLAEIHTGLDHLHFEIRYKKNTIVNPLLLMSEAMRQSIYAKFNPSDKRHFYSWSQWMTPLDQPILALAGKVIGPRGG